MLPPHKELIKVDLPRPLSPTIMKEKLIVFLTVFLFLKAAEEVLNSDISNNYNEESSPFYRVWKELSWNLRSSGCVCYCI